MNLAMNINPAVSFYGGTDRTAAATGDAYIDLAGYEGCTILIVPNAVATGTSPNFVFGLRECDTSGGTYTVVADADLTRGGPLATDVEPTLTNADDNLPHWFEYVGKKRYVRIDLESTSGTPASTTTFTGIVIRHTPRHAPIV